ncbi:hypothetical protein CRE_14019 [Caenorhabditis remanei]|uniref:C-type lectin domain-containing protein n=1 Tax=Caenorhabditis remanei TaxID=31234 RepID=E3M8U1_CAERE|nr:hypothetical protein CRE_14019 [Caenorhabditis remanei]
MIPRLLLFLSLIGVTVSIIVGGGGGGGYNDHSGHHSHSDSRDSNSRNSFYWTDGHTQNGTDAFTWNAGNPAVEYGYKDVHHVYGISSCTTLTIVSNGGQINGYWNGLMDDMWCNAKQ